MHLCARDEETYNLKILSQQKRVNINLANDKHTLTLYSFLLKTAVQMDTRASIHCIFQCLKQIRITRLLTDSSPTSHRGRGQ